MAVDFVVEGRAVPKERPRVTKSGHSYTPKATVEYEKRVRTAWKNQSGVKYEGEIALCAEIRFHMAIPKSERKKRKVGEPYLKHRDIDNCDKSVLDALNGFAYDDDKYIWKIESSKVYAERDYAEVKIYPLITES